MKKTDKPTHSKSKEATSQAKRDPFGGKVNQDQGKISGWFPKLADQDTMNPASK